MADFIKPNTAPYTSYFGKRIDPITNVVGKMHCGLDFSGHIDDNIIASADGTVIRTINEGVLGGFGNFVMLSHNINGKPYTTIYAHMSSIKVKLGQVVKRSQLLGIKGSSGKSSGKHLHFEIHTGNSRLYSEATAVDPLLYISDDSLLEVQKLLNKVGYKLVEDGIKGKATDTAIKDFQKKNGLIVDGIAGANTLAKLKGSSNTIIVSTTKPKYPNSVIKKGSTGENVKLIQKALKLIADGIFGVATESAVKTFQKNNGLTSDGIIGQQTWNKLF
ncbi:endolysin [Psychrobacillus phage Perkons]|nr:endolysin [Psychrobacillus phage Perkons]